MIIKSFDKQRSNTNNILPEHPFTTLILGSKGGGKSTLLLNLLTNEDAYKNKFNKIIFISPTWELDSKVQILKNENILIRNIPLMNEVNKRIRKKNKSIMDDDNESLIHLEDLPTKIDTFYKELTPEILDEIIIEQRSIIDNFGKKLSDKILIILDDSIMCKFLQSKKFIHAILLSRHHNLSLFFLSQCYFALHKSLRLNTTSLVLFEISNHKELELIAQEWGVGLTVKEFLEIYKQTIQKPYNFLGINAQNDRKHRLSFNLEYLIKY